MPDDIGKTLIRRAREWGATDLRIKHGGKHPRLIGSFNNDPFVFVFPGSSGDQRAALNCVSDLRRVLGVVREDKPERCLAPRRSRRRLSMRRPTRPPITAGPREDKYYAPLARLRATLSAEAGGPTEGPQEEAVVLRTPFLGRRKRLLKP